METINFGSFPRSGNHFFVDLASRLFVNTTVSWNEHRSFNPLKQKNIVTTIRNPADAVFSLCANTGELSQDFIDASLRWYKLYYEKIVELKALVIPFEELIADPVPCFIRIANTYNLNESNLLETSIMNVSGKEPINQPELLRDGILGSVAFIAANRIFEEITQQKREV
jgi:hypothetical protein